MDEIWLPNYNPQKRYKDAGTQVDTYMNGDLNPDVLLSVPDSAEDEHDALNGDEQKVKTKEKKSLLVYGVEDKPPIHIALICALQVK